MEQPKEHILACLSSAPSNAKIIRTAATMARAFHCSFTALFVQTPSYEAMPEADRERLRANVRLAQSLGAVVETVFGDDVSYQIAEYARLSGVTKIVIGRSAVTRKHPWSKPTLTEKLIAMAPNMDIHIIPDAYVDGAYRARRQSGSPVACCGTGRCPWAFCALPLWWAMPFPKLALRRRTS